MRAFLTRLLDGIVTGLAFSALLWLLSRRSDAPLDRFSGWLFYASVGMILLAALWGLASPSSTGGLLRWLGLLPAAAAEASSETLPRKIWVDRFVTSRNVWLISGLTMLILSFLLLFAS